MPKPVLFLSHASADIKLAAFLEDVVRASIPGVDVFRTTRSGQLVAGRGWFEEIDRRLRRATSFLLLVTPQSHDRWWVMFEAGAALRSGKPFAPVIAGDLKPENVNEPLKFLTLRRLSVEDEAALAFAELGGTLADPTAFVTEIARLSEYGRQAAVANEGWKQTVFAGATYAWAGPLSRLAEEQPVDEPPGLEAHLASLGLQNRFGFLHDPIEGSDGYVPIYRIDEWQARHRLIRAANRQVMWVKEIPKRSS